MSFWLKPRSLGLLLAFTLGLYLLFLFLILPPNFRWMGFQNADGDLAQHLSGWYAFIQEPWQFPLLKVTSLNYPAGTTISLTDSIPLFALIFKFCRSFLPLGFNFFGIFVLSVYLFQALSALCLAYAVNKNNMLATLALVGLALTTPLVSSAIGAVDSLAAQGFILLSISGYFFAYQQKLRVRACHIFFGILIGASLLVHPYLTAMIYPFYLLSLFKIKANMQLLPKALFTPFLMMHLLLLLEYLLCGLGQGHHTVDGFGIVTMNLLAPLYGGWFFNDRSIVINPAQMEGFTYLGWGLISMIILAIGARWGQLQFFFKQYKGLCLLGLFFFILSIYGRIYFGPFKVLEYGVPHFFLTSDFRTNGRFFWPVAYLSMVFAIVTLLNKMPRLSVWLLPFLLCVQLFDVSGYMRTARATLFSRFSAPTLSNPALTQIKALIQSNKIVVFYPKIACPNMHVEDYNLLIQTQLLAAEVNIPINTAYVAHLESSVDCNDEANDFLNLYPKLLVSRVDNPSPTIQLLLKVKPQSCQIIDQTYYCEYYS